MGIDNSDKGTNLLGRRSDKSGDQVKSSIKFVSP